MLHYQIKGQGPGLFFLHGFLEDAEIWDRIVGPLSLNYTCIQIDFPGYGTNAESSFPDQLAEISHALETLRAKLSLDTFSIVGHSMGVYIGLAWLEMAKIQPQTFVAVNGSVYTDNPERLIERKRSISLIERHKDAYIKMAIKGLFLQEQLTLYLEEIAQLTARALKTPKLALTQSIRAMSTRIDHQHTLKNFLGQKHIVAGDQDPLFPLTLSRDMALNTGAKLHTYSGSHMGWLEAPELILNVLGSERIPSASN